MQCACASLSGCIIFFLNYFINGTMLEKKITAHKMRFWFYLKHFSETFSLLRITERDMIENVRWSSCILSVNSCQTLKKLEIFDRFSKNIETQKFMKLFPVRAEFFLSDGQTDMTKLTGSVRNFAKGLTDNHRVCAVRTLSELNFNIQEVHVLNKFHDS